MMRRTLLLVSLLALASATPVVAQDPIVDIVPCGDGGPGEVGVTIAGQPPICSSDATAVVASCLEDPPGADCPANANPDDVIAALCGPGAPFEGTPACDPVDPTTLLSPPPSVAVTTTARGANALKESDAAGAVFTFTRTEDPTAVAPGSDITVSFTLTGTATFNTDYTARVGATELTSATGTIVVPADPGTATLTIIPLRDRAHPEAEETLIATVNDGTGYVANNPADASTRTMGLVSVAFNTVTITASDATALEGSTSDKGRYTITRDEPITAPLKVKLGAPTGGVANTDFEALPAFIEIPAGSATADLTLTATDNNAVGGKTITLPLAEVAAPEAGFAVPYGVGTPSSAAVAITDNDSPTVTIEVTDASFNETTNTGAIRLSRTNVNTASALEVAFTTSGTAVRGTDYALTGVPTATTLTLAANQLTRTMTLSAIADTTREGTETAILTLQPAGDASYQLGTTGVSATLNLVDDDVPAVTLTAPASTQEGNTTGATVTFRRSAQDAASEVTATFRVTGTAGAGDYTFVSNANVAAAGSNFTVRFPANVLTVGLVVRATDDSLVEGNEQIAFTILAPASSLAYGVGTPNLATLTLLDNDIVDVDQDTIEDLVDNCLGTANRDQADADADGQGNACDLDDDNDGLADTDEATRQTNPLIEDSDADGRSDGAEVAAATNPLDIFSPDYRAGTVAASVVASGVRVTWKAPAGSLADRYLVFRASDPTLVEVLNATAGQASYAYVDTAFPGGEHQYYVQAMLPSQAGTAFNTTAAGSPSTKLVATVCSVYPADGDQDGLCDRQEAQLGTDPAVADTDLDGLTDKEEVDAGSDPTDPLSPSTVAGGKIALAKEGPFWIGLVLVVAIVVLLVVGISLARRRSSAPAPAPEQT